MTWLLSLLLLRALAEPLCEQGSCEDTALLAVPRHSLKDIKPVKSWRGDEPFTLAGKST